MMHCLHIYNLIRWFQKSCDWLTHNERWDNVRQLNLELPFFLSRSGTCSMSNSDMYCPNSLRWPSDMAFLQNYTSERTIIVMKQNMWQRTYPTHKKYSSAIIFAIFASWGSQFHIIFIYVIIEGKESSLHKNS